MLITVVQSHTHAKRHKRPLKIDVASLTSTLSASPAIIRNASVLNLLNCVFIYWCEYYLTLSSTQILIGLCIRAFRDRRLSKNVDTYAPSMLTTSYTSKKSSCYDLVVILHQSKKDSLNVSILRASQNDAR